MIMMMASAAPIGWIQLGRFQAKIGLRDYIMPGKSDGSYSLTIENTEPAAIAITRAISTYCKEKRPIRMKVEYRDEITSADVLLLAWTPDGITGKLEFRLVDPQASTIRLLE